MAQSAADRLMAWLRECGDQAFGRSGPGAARSGLESRFWNPFGILNRECLRICLKSFGASALRLD